MKKIKAAAKVSKSARLKALAGSTDVNASSSAPSTARAAASRSAPAPTTQSAPMVAPSGGGMSGLSQPMPQMQVKRGGAVKKRGLGGSLMGGMGGGLPGMGGKKDEEKRARGGAVKHHMTAGAGSGEGRLQKIGK